MTDWEFVFDGVVGFLTSPIWNVPIVTFIEKNCIVFEPNDENKITYTEIHKEYSALVEDLLSSYLKDLGISEEQFVSACEAGSNDSSSSTDRSIFEQVWAGDDFELFKKLMVKKNLELELQALHMIQHRNGVVPQVFASETNKNSHKKSRSKHQTDEESLLKEVMEQSRLEYEKEKGKRKEIERMEKTLALSKEESERLHELAERELNELERIVALSLTREKELQGTMDAKKSTKKKPESKAKSSPPKSKGEKAEVKSVAKNSAKETPRQVPVQTKPSAAKQKSEPSSSSNEKTEPIGSVAEPAKQRTGQTEARKSPPSSGSVQLKSSPRQRPTASVVIEPKLPSLKAQSTPAEAAANWILSAKAEVGAPSSKNPTESQTREKTSVDDEVMKRANYMRMQREKLVEKKKQERAKRLQTFEAEQPVKRPMSSRVALRVTQETEAEKPSGGEGNELDQKKLAMRRALAERLKKEVINQQ